jgi:23S rRNA pseudouridine1911/1915/1917 synthase
MNDDVSPDLDDLPVTEDDDVAVVTVYELRSAAGAKRVRLDQFIVRSVENASRSRIKMLVEAGGVEINGRVVLKPGRLVIPGDLVRVTIPKPPPPELIAEDIPLNIVFEDESIIIVNKPAGMVTHPAFGNYTGTLVNALLHHTRELSLERGEERAGILHRLDKDTSGLLAVAKTDLAHQYISRQFASHEIEREYQAIVWGSMPTKRGRIDAPLARHPSDRKKMAVVEGGKEAITGYEVLRDYGFMSHIRLKLETGRTHQIRVHLASLRHPVFGDPTYGGRRILYGNITARYKQLISDLLVLLPRQALHARTLGFRHPVSKELVRFECPLPLDMETALAMIEQFS